MLRLSQRLLPILQLTRMALVFTALADSACAWMLWARGSGGSLRELFHRFPADQAIAVAAMSVGLYGFGMSLNDIIDRRRDKQLASHRPLPSGRIGVRTAHAVCVLLAAMGIAGAAYFAHHAPGRSLCLVLAAFTLLLILYYNLVGKYLVAPGLLTLGLIRFFHAAIPFPQLPVLWHPLLLLNHMTVVSTVSYAWEQKRPSMNRRHIGGILGGLLAIDLLFIGLVIAHRHLDQPNLQTLASALSIQPGLVVPGIALAVFIIIARTIREFSANLTSAGRNLTLVGVLWLIVYDTAFVAGYVGLSASLLVLSMLPISCIAVWLARWWTRMIILSKRPAFRRVELR